MTFPGFSPRQASTGIGLQKAHYKDFLKERQPVAWLEIQAEDFLNFETEEFQFLERIREDYPMSLHVTNLSLGSSDGIDEEHIKRVKALIDRLNPFLISSHLSWGRIDGYYLNGLFPIPYTQETLELLVSTVNRVQEIFESPLLIENPPTYLQYKISNMEEVDFLGTLVHRTGSGILLNINNVYVSCHNHGWDVEAYLKGVPKGKVKEIHISGHRIQGPFLVSDHESDISNEVWNIYQKAIHLFGPVPTLIKRKTTVPDLKFLLAEAQKAQNILNQIRTPSNTTRKERHVRFG
ncbi:MAG: DUF692 domain-containing protein [Alphaproteobacteria bacterium]|nr:DUF692 domain-containing protein [Alphaproteobacteria bacterium]